MYCDTDVHTHSTCTYTCVLHVCQKLFILCCTEVYASVYKYVSADSVHHSYPIAVYM